MDHGSSPILKNIINKYNCRNHEPTEYKLFIKINIYIILKATK